MVCRASGYYGTAFKAGRGVTQGGVLSAKLFNILVNAVVREWLHQLREGKEFEEDELLEMMATFFAIFYVDDVYLASWDAGFLQRALDVLVELFERVGLQTNTYAVWARDGFGVELSRCCMWAVWEGIEGKFSWLPSGRCP